MPITIGFPRLSPICFRTRSNFLRRTKKCLWAWSGMATWSVYRYATTAPASPLISGRIYLKSSREADATNSREIGGTGLGLSIVKQIIERLGGEVSFNDAPSGGTIFRVELPALLREEVV